MIKACGWYVVVGLICCTAEFSPFLSNYISKPFNDCSSVRLILVYNPLKHTTMDMTLLLHTGDLVNCFHRLMFQLWQCEVIEFKVSFHFCQVLLALSGFIFRSLVGFIAEYTSSLTLSPTAIYIYFLLLTLSYKGQGQMMDNSHYLWPDRVTASLFIIRILLILNKENNLSNTKLS